VAYGRGGPPNKGMKLTSVEHMNARSLSLVLDGPVAGLQNGRGLPDVATSQLPLLSKGALQASRVQFVGGCREPIGKKSQLMSFSCSSSCTPRVLTLRSPALESRLALQRGASQLLQRASLPLWWRGVALQQRHCLVRVDMRVVA